MSDYDPNRLDPSRRNPNLQDSNLQDTNLQDPNLQDSRDVPFNSGGGFNWSWVLGGIAAIVLLLAAMSLINNSERNAAGIAPSDETTGQSPPAMPAERMSPRPASPNQ